MFLFVLPIIFFKYCLSFRLLSEIFFTHNPPEKKEFYFLLAAQTHTSGWIFGL